MGTVSKRHEVGPFADPALKPRVVVGLHQLKAAAEFGADPAGDELKVPARHSDFVAEASVYGPGVVTAKPSTTMNCIVQLSAWRTSSPQPHEYVPSFDAGRR
jgi:hypothetical protein